MATGDERPLTTANLSEIGFAGLKQYSGFIQEDPDQELNGQALRRALRQLTDTDPIAGAMYKAISLLIAQVDRNVAPASPKRRDVKDAEFLQTAFDDMSSPMPSVIGEALTMFIYGFSLSEVVYKERHGPDGTTPSDYDDGLVGWRKWAPRPQDTVHRWLFDAHGGLKGFEQAAPPSFTPTFIPIERLLLFRPETTKNNPEGRSIFRNALRPAYFKRNLEQIEAIGIERDLAGLPKLGLPLKLMQQDATESDKALLAQMVALMRAIRRDENEGVIYPLIYDDKGNELIKLELMNSGGQRQFDTGSIIVRYDQRIAIVALADFLLIGHEKVGSFALSSTKSDLFQAALRTWVQGIEAVINDYAIPRLFAVNGWRRENYPRLVFGAIKHIDLALLGETIKNLAAAGAMLFPSRTLEDALLDRLGLPIPPDDDRPDPDDLPVAPVPPPGQPPTDDAATPPAQEKKPDDGPPAPARGRGRQPRRAVAGPAAA